jgi:hypothetical protein
MKGFSKKIFLGFMLLVSMFSASGQNGWQFLDSIPAKGDYIISDELGFVYLINGNQVSRYDMYGNLTGTYCKLIDGPITCADAGDPLKILLFYKDYGRIKFLDKTMSAQGSDISLAPLGFQSASLACLSYQNAFWIYDPSSVQLVRFTNALQQDQITGNINQISGFEIHPDALYEAGNTVYLKDTARGILMFDRYGAYLRCLPFLSVKWFTVKDDHLIFLTGNELHSYNMKSKEEVISKLPLTDVASMAYENGMLFALKRGSLHIYSVKK